MPLSFGLITQPNKKWPLADMWGHHSQGMVSTSMHIS